MVAALEVENISEMVYWFIIEILLNAFVLILPVMSNQVAILHMARKHGKIMIC